MHVDYKNPGHLKMCLLLEGVKFTEKALTDVGTKYLERKYPYNSGDDFIDNKILIPPEIILPGEIIVTVRHKMTSPWKVDIKKNNLVLRHNNKVICRVSFPIRPSYYGKVLSNGVLCENVMTKYSVKNIGFFFSRYCYFFDIGLQCKFCSSEITKKRDPLMIKTITSQIATEAAKLAFKDDKSIKNIVWSSGTYKNFDILVKHLVTLISNVNKVKPSNIRHHVFIMPPYDFELIRALKEIGVDEITFSLEVFNKRLFKKICPGKHQYYGYEKFLEIMNFSSKIFGYGKVSCNFICGLEPLSSLLKGFRTVAEMGVKPSVPIFHPDPGTELENKNPPSISYIFKMAKELHKIYHKYNFVPILYKARGASLDCEIYDGYLK